MLLPYQLSGGGGDGKGTLSGETRGVIGEDCELFVYLADLGEAKTWLVDAVGNDLIINQTRSVYTARAPVCCSLPPRAEDARRGGRNARRRRRRGDGGGPFLTGRLLTSTRAAVSSADALCTRCLNRFPPLLSAPSFSRHTIPSNRNGGIFSLGGILEDFSNYLEGAIYMDWDKKENFSSRSGLSFKYLEFSIKILRYVGIL